MKVDRTSLKSSVCRMGIVLCATVSVASFAAAQPEPVNIARGCSYTFSKTPNYELCRDEGDTVQLTDGYWQKDQAADFWVRKSTVGWDPRSQTGQTVSITVDLGAESPIGGFAYNMASGVAGVAYPEFIFVYTSDDNRNWRFVGSLTAKSAEESIPPADEGYRVYRVRSTRMPCRGRYVTYLVKAASYVFCDELEVYRGEDSAVPKVAAADTTNVFAHCGAFLKHQFMLDDYRRIHGLRLGTPVDWKGGEGDLPAESVAAFRAQGFARPFFWTCERWACAFLFDHPLEAKQADGPVRVEMMRREIRTAAVNLSNPQTDDLPVTVTVSGLPATVPVRVQEVMHVPIRDGRSIGSALGHATGPSVALAVPGGRTRQVWISVERPECPAGTYRGLVAATDAAGRRIAEIPLEVTVSSVTFPDRPRLHVGGWDYSSNGNASYGTPKGLAGKMKVMRRMFTDLPWAQRSVLPGGAKFDSEGELTNPNGLDFRAWHDWVALWGDTARIFCVFFDCKPVFHGEKMGTPRFERMVESYYRAWYAGVREGLAGRKVAALIIDEPGSKALVDEIVAWSRLLKRAVPELLVFEEPTGIVTKSIDSTPLFEASDVLCPCTSWTIQQRLEKGLIAKSRGKDLWLYTCLGPSHEYDPIRYYRFQAWKAWEMGGDGSLFWAFGDDSPQDGLHPTVFRRTFSPFYSTPTDAFDAKQSEAIMESAEDFEYLAMLRDRISSLTDAAAAARARQCLDSSVKSVIDAMQGPNGKYAHKPRHFFWIDDRDRAFIDRARLDVLHELERIGVCTRCVSACCSRHWRTTSATLETQEAHNFYSWYGIHGFEPLMAVMGPGVERVSCFRNDAGDVVIAEAMSVCRQPTQP